MYMGEVFITFFIFVAVMSISVVLFGGWVAVLSYKGLSRLFGTMLVGGTASRRWPRLSSSSCQRCHQINPSHAQFCRRCGERI
jgi:hypothetical protein